MKKDNIHFNTRKIDSYNFVWNFVLSEREAGKSTAIWNKVYKTFKKKGRPSFVLRRLINDISETYIRDIETVINKFQPDNKQIKFTFKKGTIKEGICDVYIGDKMFLRVIALSNPISRVKSLIVRNPAYMIFDEFICNNRCGEKYVNDECFRFKEIYNTFQRECDGYALRCYFLGNPYSLYNPYFADLQVDTLQLKPGALMVNKSKGYVIQCYQIKPELREFILKRNPLYKFDDSYKRYAFNGLAVNDSNIQIIVKQPEGYKLKWIFRISHRYLGVYYKSMNRPDKIGFDCGKFWISIIDYVGSNRTILAVDFDNLTGNSRLITTDMRSLCWKLKDAIANRDVSYATVEASYLTEEIYSVI